jgi:hypothetical protein
VALNRSGSNSFSSMSMGANCSPGDRCPPIVASRLTSTIQPSKSRLNAAYTFAG